MKNLDEENFDDSDSECEKLENTILGDNVVDLDTSGNFVEKTERGQWIGNDSSSRTDDEEPSTSVTKNLKKVVKRKYDEDYIKYGFSWCGDETAPRPQCIICGDQLSNESMVPSKLKRHLYSSHPSCANKDKQYFKRCLEQNKKQKKFMKSAVTVSEKALEASYHVAKLIARQKKPHTVGETLIKPACMEIVRLMLGPNEVKDVNKVSLSADTVKRRAPKRYFDPSSVDGNETKLLQLCTK
ncbi:zinc finger BED domain-containing protein 5 [Nephila pilipes]|uniref:Zinc finger BED domain-containing protein 5 n=1 Tax=Nephila pilipes TaxID=299642 RepID=A0A8X6PSN3_NEPPI|nr:zinc finger BED domain-containing protein 5 [Nephila pilipes]